jgi:hypothetical protein
MIIDLPNDSAIESSEIQFVRWVPQEGALKARVLIDRRLRDQSIRESFECVSNEDAQKLSARVIKQWKESAPQPAGRTRS